MFKKLIEMNPYIKIAIFVALVAISTYTIRIEGFEFIGYILLFMSLMIINEGFGFKLITKIIIALILGAIIPLWNIYDPSQLVAIKPVGSDIFMNCLTMALVPLVFASILTGITSLGDLQKIHKIGLRTILYYVGTTALAILIGLSFALSFNPGSELDAMAKSKFEQTQVQVAQQKVEAAESNRQSMFEGLVSIFPKNIMTTVADSKPNMLQLIFFAVICGIALLGIKNEYADPVISFFKGITEMTIKLVVMVMRIAPYGVFALIASQIAANAENIELIYALIPYSAIVVVALLTHGLVLNSFSLKFLSKKDPIYFFKNIQKVMGVAFSTSSSGATMPVTLEVAEKEMGVKNEVGGFVIPLGATINMDGTALWQGISVVFLANIYGVTLGIEQYITVILYVIAASIGTAAVPGVGIVMLTFALVTVGIPAEGILFILPVNNLLDMFRTTVNVAGDLACSIYINEYDKRLTQ